MLMGLLQFKPGVTTEGVGLHPMLATHPAAFTVPLVIHLKVSPPLPDAEVYVPQATLFPTRSAINVLVSVPLKIRKRSEKVEGG